MEKSMSFSRKAVALVLIFAGQGLFAGSAVKKAGIKHSRKVETTDTGAVLWRDPADIASRNLFYGPGGKAHVPHGKFTFVKEDLDGTNPKFVVRDQDGMKWKVKLGVEARPETVASRLVWAVGYSADEDYFVQDLRVEEMPSHLHRGQNMVEPDGSVHAVRLKREGEEHKKTGIWKWRDNPFTGTRELNGLRVMMAIVNNWDLKDENNAIRGDSPPVYLVSDLGASFGSPGLERTHEKSKGNLESYSRSRLIKRIGPDYVDFETPRRPALIVLVNPHEFISRLGLRWIGRHIPRDDSRWTGELLARLSRSQIRDAFRAAGYSAEDTEAFTRIVEQRIAQLTQL
jgi:hypothetical protein